MEILGCAVLAGLAGCFFGLLIFIAVQTFYKRSNLPVYPFLPRWLFYAKRILSTALRPAG
jgi:hypothetical protein